MSDHPLQRVTLSGFGAFAEVDLVLAPRLNVIVGENSTGKSHLLAVAYAATAALHRGSGEPATPRAAGLCAAVADQLMTTVRPTMLGRLVHRGRLPGQVRAAAQVAWADLGPGLAFSFSPTARTRLAVTTAPTRWLEAAPVLIGSHVLAFARPAALVVSEHHSGRETPARQRLAPTLAVIEAALSARVVVREGRLYLSGDGIGEVEMPLVGQGQGALVTLACLIGFGTLTGDGYLFWDTPEADLGPALLTTAAAVIVGAARAGVQVLVATHSPFLLREIDLALEGPEGADLAAHTGYINLHRGPDGVHAHAGASPADVGPITALDAETDQAQRYLALDKP